MLTGNVQGWLHVFTRILLLETLWKILTSCLGLQHAHVVCPTNNTRLSGTFYRDKSPKNSRWKKLVVHTVKRALSLAVEVRRFCGLGGDGDVIGGRWGGFVRRRRLQDDGRVRGWGCTVQGWATWRVELFLQNNQTSRSIKTKSPEFLDYYLLSNENYYDYVTWI